MENILILVKSLKILFLLNLENEPLELRQRKFLSNCQDDFKSMVKIRGSIGSDQKYPQILLKYPT
jgi:hypothetical protein